MFCYSTTCPNSLVSDMTLVARNWPSSEYLHQGSQPVLQIMTFLSGEPIVEHLSALLPRVGATKLASRPVESLGTGQTLGDLIPLALPTLCV